MSERENGQLSLAKRAVRRRISAGVWQQVKTAYASGIGLREIARNMNIPEGTVLARAKREGWTRQIQNAKALAKREDSSPVVTPMEAVAVTLNERKDKSRLHLSKYVVDASKRASDSGGNLDIAQDVRHVSAVSAHLWSQDQPKIGLDLSVLNVSGDMFASKEEAEAYRDAHRRPHDAPQPGGEATDAAEC